MKKKCLVIRNWLNNTDHNYLKLLSNFRKQAVSLFHTNHSPTFETELLEETTSHKIVNVFLGLYFN
jgi:hypothetical protein